MMNEPNARAERPIIKAIKGIYAKLPSGLLLTGIARVVKVKANKEKAHYTFIGMCAAPFCRHLQ